MGDCTAKAAEQLLREASDAERCGHLIERADGEPLKPGTIVNVLLEVVAVVVVNLDACRSRDELDPPEAARTATGTPSTAATARKMMNILRMTTPLSPCWPHSPRLSADVPGLQAMCDPCEDRMEDSAGRPLRLIGGLRHGAVDAGVHARVVERPGKDGHRDRAGPAAVGKWSLVIAALPGRDATNDQPGQEKQRSETHGTLRQHRVLKARRECQPRLASHPSPPT